MLLSGCGDRSDGSPTSDPPVSNDNGLTQVVSDDLGRVNFFSSDLGVEYQLEIRDDAGTALPGIEVSYREVGGTPFLILSDPSGRYQSRAIAASPETISEILDGQLTTVGSESTALKPQIAPIVVFGIVVLVASTTSHVLAYMDASDDIELQLEEGVLDCGTSEVACLCKSPTQVAQLREAQFERDAAVTDTVIGFLLFGLDETYEAGVLVYKTWGLFADVADVSFNATIGDLIQDQKYGARESDTWGPELDENQPYLTYFYDFTDDEAKKQLLTFMTDEPCDPASADEAATGELQLEGYSGSINRSQLAASFRFVLDGLSEDTPVRVDVIGDDGTVETYELRYEPTYSDFPDLGQFSYLPRRGTAKLDRVFVTVPRAYLARSVNVTWASSLLRSFGYQFNPESPAILSAGQSVEAWWDWEGTFDRPYEACLEGDAMGASCLVTQADTDEHRTTFAPSSAQLPVNEVDFVWREALPPHRRLASNTVAVDFSYSDLTNEFALIPWVGTLYQGINDTLSTQAVIWYVLPGVAEDQPFTIKLSGPGGWGEVDIDASTRELGSTNDRIRTEPLSGIYRAEATVDGRALSGDASVDSRDVLAVATGVDVLASGADNVHITWNAVPGAELYEVQINEVGTSYYPTDLTENTSSTFPRHDLDLTLGAEYRVFVIAHSADYRPFRDEIILPPQQFNTSITEPRCFVAGTSELHACP